MTLVTLAVGAAVTVMGAERCVVTFLPSVWERPVNVIERAQLGSELCWQYWRNVSVDNYRERVV